MKVLTKKKKEREGKKEKSKKKEEEEEEEAFNQTFRRKMLNKKTDLPSMKEHVEGKPPELKAFVRPVYKDAVDRDRPRGIHFAHHRNIVREKSQLKTNKIKILHL